MKNNNKTCNIDKFIIIIIIIPIREKKKKKTIHVNVEGQEGEYDQFKIKKITTHR